MFTALKTGKAKHTGFRSWPPLGSMGAERVNSPSCTTAECSMKKQEIVPWRKRLAVQTDLHKGNGLTILSALSGHTGYDIAQAPQGQAGGHETEFWQMEVSGYDTSSRSRHLRTSAPFLPPFPFGGDLGIHML